MTLPPVLAPIVAHRQRNGQVLLQTLKIPALSETLIIARKIFKMKSDKNLRASFCGFQSLFVVCWN